mmetsp:Transcript_85429/g.104790  ORF Transcript_85429/g.104790 Transcript_85429/m.104790 type:complete len:604 (+) Transcript_85429:40-1851(+)
MAQDEENRALVASDGVTENSSCSCCCVFRWTLILALLGVGALVALVVCLPEPKKEMDSNDKEFDELAQVVLQLATSEKLKHEAQEVEADAEWGKDLKADAKKIMDLLRAMEGELSPLVAAQIGIEITSDDIARMLGVMGTHGHQFNLEDAKKGAFQGDMVPENTEQLKQLVAQAENAQKVHWNKKQRGSFGAGAPWSKGVVNYCFHKSATDSVKEAIRLAIQQYKKSVPCIQFKDVGPSGDQCGESPAVLITSENNGCWSYVGMLKHRDVQELNLQSPGCDSVGTALHELGHALGMAHEQSRPDRDDYVEIHDSQIQGGKKHNFRLDARGDMERPYDLLSIMHYDADAFATSNKPTITAKDKAYSLYTDDPHEYEYIRMGNRVGLTQLDADQLADLYRAVNGFCVSHLLGDGGGEGASCSDLQKNGEPWKDKYDQDCDDYVRMEEKGHVESCSKYSAGRYCCDCGGGLRLQKWSWECDLCRPITLSGCHCQPGPFTLFGKTSSTTCGNPGYNQHSPMCVVDASCENKFTLDGVHLAHCGSYTGFTTKGCRCKRHQDGWTYKDTKVPTTCGNPNGHKHGPWCYVEDGEKECQGDVWGTCEIAKP